MESDEILLVEDNPDDAELTLRAFRRHHLANRVRVVRDGVEALDFLFGQGAFAARSAADLPRLMLLDLKLPRVGGIEVLRRVRQDRRTLTIPVVVLTSSNAAEDIEECSRLG